MKLQELLAALPTGQSVASRGGLDAEVTGLSTNSHACKPGNVFVGMPGTRVDGGEFWPSALAEGAIAAVISQQAYEKRPPSQEASSPCVIAVPNGDDPAIAMAEASAALAAKFYNYPTKQLHMVGVTGTNGKTTTTHLIEFFLQRAQQQVALLGTLYTRWQGYQKTAVHTTPFALELQAQLAEAVAAGCTSAVMEVSSHALAQGRVNQCEFEAAVFTNLTQDHLDYHKDMEDYFASKARLFAPNMLRGRAIVNLDDPYGQRLLQSLPAEQRWSYSTQSSDADLWTSDLSYEPDGVKGMLHTPKGAIAFKSPLVGQFNLANLLAATGAALHLGVELTTIVQSLPHFTGVPGRVETVQIQPEQDIRVIVDYAHTPDSLENLLKASRPFIQGRMICVFGCGGDRDRTKRPQMGAIAARLADWVIVTSDNPRTEDPQRILEDVVAGIPAEVQPLVLKDRAEAIRTAILQAQPGDGVLIAGKGHEDYQILGTEKIHFDDREQARDALATRFSVTA
ncbi:UDP-N-acetylmuramoyl-L-alanyl-D-glutamate--2,6-diaminopimelate ligase [Leptolyngbya sp. AN02str]|uniref:UDP-N-acetylmuramoyl-L-alanyl-D-glutamate--2, 6-diaminopimelate ligase n=1 Tax=Leptolyngbya sp. AN02str TaxID=3423363 RepID=UPI003D31913C